MQILPSKAKVDQVSEAVKDYGVSLLVLVLTVCSILVTIAVLNFMSTATKELTDISVSTQKMERSIRELPVNMNRYVLRDKEFWNTISKGVKDTFADVHGLSEAIKRGVGSIVADSHQLSQSLVQLTDHGSTLVMSATAFIEQSKTLVQNTDFTINGKLAPEVVNVLKHLDGKTLVMIDEKIAGVLDTASDSLEVITKDVHDFIGDPKMQADLKAAVGQIKITMEEGVTPMAINIAKILTNSADVTKYYRDKLLSPNWKDRVKAFFNTALYFFGEIVSPWVVSNQVTRVRVIQ